MDAVEQLVWVLTGGVSEDPNKDREQPYEGSCATCGEELGTVYAGPECKA